MRRPARIVLLALAVLAFLAVSAGLARVLSANGAERSAIEQLLSAQARGDEARMVAHMEGCRQRPACIAQAQANAQRLRSTGTLQIVRLDPSTDFSPAGSDGTARVVWRTTSRITVVQCVRVHRAGDVLSGLTIELRALSAPIGHEASCPSGG